MTNPFLMNTDLAEMMETIKAVKGPKHALAVAAASNIHALDAAFRQQIDHDFDDRIIGLVIANTLKLICMLAEADMDNVLTDLGAMTSKVQQHMKTPPHRRSDD